MFGEISGFIAATAAFGALIFTGVSFMKLRKTEQFRLAESMSRDIRTLGKEYNLLSAESPETDEEEQTRLMKLERLSEHYFGSVDWLGFLIINGEIKDKRLVNYFKRGIIDWYENMFVNHMSPEIVNDDTRLRYFKTLYKKYKNEQGQ